MALTTYPITGDLKDALGGDSLIGEVTLTPYGSHDARVDGANALLGAISYDLDKTEAEGGLPATLDLTAGAWIITIRAKGRVQGEQQFKTIQHVIDHQAATTWGAIVSGAVSSPPMTPTLVQQAQDAATAAEASATTASADAAAADQARADAEAAAATATAPTDSMVASLAADPASATGAELRETIGSETAYVAGRTGRQNVFHVIGDSISANGVNVAGSPLFGDARNPWAWTMLLSNGRLQLGTIAATGGHTTSQILAEHLPTALAAARPGDRIIVLGGTNDAGITGGINGTLCRANLLSMYEQIEAAGCFPVGCSIPPVGYAFGAGAVTGAETPADAGKRLSLSTWIENTAKRRGWEFLDLYSTLTNPIATGSVYEGSLAQDATHPNTLGGREMGEYAAAHLAADDTPVVRLASHRIASGDGLLLIGNATMGDANADGIPDQFTSTSFTGTATPFSLVTDPDCVGPMFKVRRDAAATANTLAQTSGVAVVPGNRYFFGFKVKANVPGGAGGAGRVIAHLYDGASTYLAGISLSGFDQSFPTSVFATEFVMPAGVTSARFHMRASSAECDISVGQLTLIDLTAQGLA